MTNREIVHLPGSAQDVVKELVAAHQQYKSREARIMSKILSGEHFDVHGLLMYNDWIYFATQEGYKMFMDECELRNGRKPLSCDDYSVCTMDSQLFLGPEVLLRLAEDQSGVRERIKENVRRDYERSRK
jgi:hypothetical protein